MDGQKIVYSPISLWKDFDAEALPLDIEEISVEEKDGIVYSYVYFNGNEYQDGISRIYGVFARKKDASNLPAIIVLDEIGQRMKPREVEFWAKRGYAVLSFDNMGESEELQDFTKYPPSVKYANFAYSGRHLTNCDTNAKETCFYHWAANARRAVTFVARQSCVDVSSIGLIAYKESTVIACMVGASDDRLSVCATVFGMCYQDVEVARGQTNSENAESSDERERWFAGIAPQSYLLHMKTPFLLCTGANAALTDLDKTYEAMCLIPKETPWAMWIANRLLDTGLDYFVKNLDKWLELHLKNQSAKVSMPSASYRVLNKKLNVIARVKDDREIQSVAVYYSREAKNSSARNWVEKVPQKLADGIYRAEVEIYDKTQGCYAFCNVTYKNGMTLSSNLVDVPLESLATVLESQKTKIIYNGGESDGMFQVYAPNSCVETAYEEKLITTAKGPFGIKGVKGKRIATFALNDSRYIKGDDSILAFDVYSKDGQDLTISVVADYGTNQKVYSLTKKLVGGQMWQKVCVAPYGLKGDRGRNLDSWNHCQVLCFEAQNDVLINNIVLT